MLGFIEGLFTLVSFILLTASWIFIVSLISYYISLILKANNIRPNPLVYSIVLGIILEVILSAVSIVLSGQPATPANTTAGIISGLEKGYSLTALLSPISSLVGAIIGIKKRRRPGRFF